MTQQHKRQHLSNTGMSVDKSPEDIFAQWDRQRSRVDPLEQGDNSTRREFQPREPEIVKPFRIATTADIDKYLEGTRDRKRAVGIGSLVKPAPDLGLSPADATPRSSLSEAPHPRRP